MRTITVTAEGKPFEFLCAEESGPPSPFGEEVQVETEEWLRDFGLTGLVPEEKLAGVGRLCALVYPRATRSMLRVASDWTALFFLIDDLSESLDLEQVKERNRRLVEALRYYGASHPDAVTSAFIAIMCRIGIAAPSQTWFSRFENEVLRWLGGHAWEATNRQRGRTPPVEEYLRMRQATIGMQPEFLLAEAADHIKIPDADAAMARVLREYASWQISLCNDVLTYRREMASGEVHNFVMCAMVERGIDAASAVGLAVNHHNHVLQCFADAAIAPARDSELGRLARALEDWMTGHLAWGIHSKRYDLGGA